MNLMILSPIYRWHRVALRVSGNQVSLTINCLTPQKWTIERSIRPSALDQGGFLLFGSNINGKSKFNVSVVIIS